jgi:hypothetical protein
MTDQDIKTKLSGKDLHLIIDLKKSKVNHKETSMVHLLLKVLYHLHHLIMKERTCQVVIQDPEDLEMVDTFIVMEENMMTMNLKANMTTNLKANMATKESMAEKAIMEERTSKDIKVKTIGTIMEKMISTELNITLSTFYTQSNSLT